MAEADANQMMKTTNMKTPMLIEQGSADEFLERELTLNYSAKHFPKQELPCYIPH
ncbi:MAG: hypothetical protein CM1200mP30_29550 [Pseudomonadota bacterium]|nr:MAG: hypothetical protein CM1200mP30_29550 [Pseudomonadota bacterium]